jgi:hypothetical protein
MTTNIFRYILISKQFFSDSMEFGNPNDLNAAAIEIFDFRAAPRWYISRGRLVAIHTTIS